MVPNLAFLAASAAIAAPISAGGTVSGAASAIDTGAERRHGGLHGCIYLGDAIHQVLHSKTICRIKV